MELGRSFENIVRLVYPLGRPTEASPLEIETLALDLTAHTLGGLVISFAGLAWHGMGFDAGHGVLVRIFTRGFRVAYYLF